MDTLKDKKIKNILSVISVLGMIVMGYLIYLHFSSHTGICSFSEGFSCDIVNKSSYAKIWGIPVSVLGLIYFLGVFLVNLLESSKKSLKWISLATILFLGPSLYLSGIEYLVLKSICIFCELSKVLMISIAIISWKGSVSGGKEDLKSESLFFVLILGIGLAILTFFAQRPI